jgi:hypothetical protein
MKEKGEGEKECLCNELLYLRVYLEDEEIYIVMINDD